MLGGLLLRIALALRLGLAGGGQLLLHQGGVGGFLCGLGTPCIFQATLALGHHHGFVLRAAVKHAIKAELRQLREVAVGKVLQEGNQRVDVATALGAVPGFQLALDGVLAIRR